MVEEFLREVGPTRANTNTRTDHGGPSSIAGVERDGEGRGVGCARRNPHVVQSSYCTSLVPSRANQSPGAAVCQYGSRKRCRIFRPKVKRPTRTPNEGAWRRTNAIGRRGRRTRNLISSPIARRLPRAVSCRLHRRLGGKHQFPEKVIMKKERSRGRFWTRKKSLVLI